MLGGPDHSGPENFFKKIEEKEKVDQEEPEEHSSVKKRRIQNCGQKKIVFGGPTEYEARKASRKAMRAFGRVDFALANQKRVQAVILIHTRARARIKKVRERKVLIHNQDFQLLKIPLKRDKVIPGHQAIDILIALTILQRLRDTIQNTLLG